VESSDLAEVQWTLWAAADQLRANSTLAPNEYRGPVFGLIFLAYAEHRLEQVRPELEAAATARRPVTPDDYKAKSVLFVPEEARLSRHVDLPEMEDLGVAVDTAMRLIETNNPELKDVLPAPREVDSRRAAPPNEEREPGSPERCERRQREGWCRPGHSPAALA
jgi:type I restriction enzyme M protein